ncbi:MAG: ribosome small subunit-dependent GTPase A [Acidimicrobiia bacterium]|nr:ribosome small subunit-dependent GTPase A [Acidimicrobiia bacterium]
MDPTSLRDYGWDDEVARAWQDEATDEAVVGRVARVDRGECDVVTADGAIRALSDSQRAQGARAPATGDWVSVVQDELGPVIDRVLPRRTAIVRRDPAERLTEQVLVANVDVVGIVHALDQELRPARLERFLALAFDSGAEPLIIIAKNDLDGGDAAAAVIGPLAPDVDVVRVTATTGDGVMELADRIAGRTIVFIGLSGSGKSTLVNALLGTDVQDIADVRNVDGKGRHTTTSRELFVLPGGGVLIDTPGVRSIGLWAAADAVDRVYGDISEMARNCRFRDCTHDREPGCAVQAAVATGDLDGDRVERHRRLVEELVDQDAEREEHDRRRKRGRPSPTRRPRR